MSELISRCVSYLINKCNTKNALLHYSIAENNNLPIVSKRIFKFIVGNFLDVAAGPHIEYLPGDRLNAILASDHLRVQREVDVFDVGYSYISLHLLSI